MSTSTILHSLQSLLTKNNQGLAITELQIQMFQEFKLQLSYKAIENVIFQHPGLFIDVDGKWKLR